MKKYFSVRTYLNFIRLQLIVHQESIFSKLIYLFQTKSPIKLYYFLIKDMILNKIYLNQYQSQINSFRNRILIKNFGEDWFTEKSNFWFKMFAVLNLKDKELNILEIGSWKGLSTYFLLSELNNSKVTCVDTWEGSDEHKNFLNDDISNMENIYDQNLQEYANRINKFKGFSYSYFAHNSVPEFDLIYIDGSHRSQDVLIDGFKSFEILKKGGVIIFDDYFWRFYENYEDNPAFAINHILKFYKKRIKILFLNYQIAFLKIN